MKLFSVLIILFSLTSCSSIEVSKMDSPAGIMSDVEAENDLFYSLARFDEISEDMLKKVDINVKSKFGETLTYAAAYSTTENLRKVIKAGGPIEEKNFFKLTPLHASVARGKIENAELLLKAGANINSVDALGNPIFFEALDDKSMDMLLFLMKYNFDPNVVGFMDRTWKSFEFAETVMAEYVKKYNRLNPKPEVKEKQP